MRKNSTIFCTIGNLSKHLNFIHSNVDAGVSPIFALVIVARTIKNCIVMQFFFSRWESSRVAHRQVDFGEDVRLHQDGEGQEERVHYQAGDADLFVELEFVVSGDGEEADHANHDRYYAVLYGARFDLDISSGHYDPYYPRKTEAQQNVQGVRSEGIAHCHVTVT